MVFYQKWLGEIFYNFSDASRNFELILIKIGFFTNFLSLKMSQFLKTKGCNGFNWTPKSPQIFITFSDTY